MSKYSDITSQVNPSKLESKRKNRDHNKKNKSLNIVKYTQVFPFRIQRPRGSMFFFDLQA